MTTKAKTQPQNGTEQTEPTTTVSLTQNELGLTRDLLVQTSLPTPLAKMVGAYLQAKVEEALQGFDASS